MPEIVKLLFCGTRLFKSDTVKDVNILSNSVPYGELFFKEDIDRILSDIDSGGGATRTSSRN